MRVHRSYFKRRRCGCRGIQAVTACRHCAMCAPGLSSQGSHRKCRQRSWQAPCRRLEPRPPPSFCCVTNQRGYRHHIAIMIWDASMIPRRAPAHVMRSEHGCRSAAETIAWAFLLFCTCFLGVGSSTTQEEDERTCRQKRCGKGHCATCGAWAVLWSGSRPPALRTRCHGRGMPTPFTAVIRSVVFRVLGSAHVAMAL